MFIVWNVDYSEYYCFVHESVLSSIYRTLKTITERVGTVLKRIIMFCFLLILLPTAILANDEADWTENIRRQERCAELAKTLPERSMNGNGFFVMGTDDTHMKPFHELAKNNIDIVVTNHIGIFANLRNTLFHQDDTDAIKAVIENCNRYYLSSMTSGYWALMPRELFTNDGIYKEANARNLYQIFYWQDVGVGTSEEHFRYDINTLHIDGNYAQVIITRNAELSSAEPIDGVIQAASLETNVREAYLLQKHDGEWKIENIIFDNRAYFNGTLNDIMNIYETKLNTFLMFERANSADVWKEGFNFENCQPKNYSPYGNYSDFIIGTLNRPQFDYDRFLYLQENLSRINQFWNETDSNSETTLNDYRTYKDGNPS